MTDYARMSREELVARLQALEPSGRNDPNTAENALRESEERMRAILETAVEGIITIDERGLIELINPAAEKLFGFSAAEVKGKNVNMLMPSPDRENHDAYLANYLRTGKAKIIGIGREVLGQRKDGTIFPMDLAVSEVRLPNRRLFTGFIRDITDRKRAEQQLADLAQSLAEKNKELETVVYVASHDLRSPLVNIQGFSKELASACERVRNKVASSDSHTISKAELESILNEDVPEAIDYIMAGVAKIDSLLSGFLRFSRLGRAAFHIHQVNVTSLLASIVHAMEFQIKKSGASVLIEPLPECYADETQLNQVFWNLLENAIKYLDPRRPGAIKVTGRLENGRAIYSVEDNGIGIAPEHQTKIFEIFHRLDPSLGEGEGLGLAIAQRSIERQNGKIWVESEAGKGSIFHVSLPALPPKEKLK